MSAVLAKPTFEAIYPVRIDWSRLMRELRQFGWTPYKVATTMCADPPTAYAWEQGAEPRHSYGAALLALHAAVCGPEYSEKLNSDSKAR